VEQTFVTPVALFFFAMGLVALAAPDRVLGTFGVRVDTAAGRTEVRAVYGGFGMAIAGLLVAAIAAEGGIADGILTSVGVALAGMAGGRLFSAALREQLSFWPTWTFCAAELGLAALLLAALFSN
jgi:hypothetical protein